MLELVVNNDIEIRKIGIGESTFKINDIELFLHKNLDEMDCRHFFSMRQPILSGDTILMSLFHEIEFRMEKEKEVPSATLKASAVMLVKVNKFNADRIKAVLKFSLVGLTYPYLRAHLSTVIATSGLGSYYLPIVNPCEFFKVNEQEIDSMIDEIVKLKENKE